MIQIDRTPKPAILTRKENEWRTDYLANLLLSCGVCNGKQHKSDHFPKASEG